MPRNIILADLICVVFSVYSHIKMCIKTVQKVAIKPLSGFQVFQTLVWKTFFCGGILEVVAGVFFCQMPSFDLKKGEYPVNQVENKTGKIVKRKNCS